MSFADELEKIQSVDTSDKEFQNQLAIAKTPVVKPTSATATKPVDDHKSIWNQTKNFFKTNPYVGDVVSTVLDDVGNIVKGVEKSGLGGSEPDMSTERTYKPKTPVVPDKQLNKYTIGEMILKVGEHLKPPNTPENNTFGHKLVKASAGMADFLGELALTGGEMAPVAVANVVGGYQRRYDELIKEGQTPDNASKYAKIMMPIDFVTNYANGAVVAKLPFISKYISNTIAKYPFLQSRIAQALTKGTVAAGTMEAVGTGSKTAEQAIEGKPVTPGKNAVESIPGAMVGGGIGLAHAAYSYKPIINKDGTVGDANAGNKPKPDPAGGLKNANPPGGGPGGPTAAGPAQAMLEKLTTKQHVDKISSVSKDSNDLKEASDSIDAAPTSVDNTELKYELMKKAEDLKIKEDANEAGTTEKPEKVLEEKPIDIKQIKKQINSVLKNSVKAGSVKLIGDSYQPLNDKGKQIVSFTDSLQAKIDAELSIRSHVNKSETMIKSAVATGDIIPSGEWYTHVTDKGKQILDYVNDPGKFKDNKPDNIQKIVDENKPKLSPDEQDIADQIGTTKELLDKNKEMDANAEFEKTKTNRKNDLKKYEGKVIPGRPKEKTDTTPAKEITYREAKDAVDKAEKDIRDVIDSGLMPTKEQWKAKSEADKILRDKPSALNEMRKGVKDGKLVNKDEITDKKSSDSYKDNVKKDNENYDKAHPDVLTVDSVMKMNTAVYYNGKLHVGDVGESHQSIKNKNKIVNEDDSAHGFTFNGEEFMSREQAKKWFKENDKENYKRWKNLASKSTDELHSQDYRRAIGRDEFGQPTHITIQEMRSAGFDDYKEFAREYLEDPEMQQGGITEKEFANIHYCL